MLGLLFHSESLRKNKQFNSKNKAVKSTSHARSCLQGWLCLKLAGRRDASVDESRKLRFRFVLIVGANWSVSQLVIVGKVESRQTPTDRVVNSWVKCLCNGRWKAIVLLIKAGQYRRTNNENAMN
jgi:hypothetical protein